MVGRKTKVQVNGKSIGFNRHVYLNGGDEVVFGTSGRHAYVSFHPPIFILHCFFINFSVGSIKVS